jgi:hypothetical protein
MKNVALKEIKGYGVPLAKLREDAYQVWQTPDGRWTWYVLKMWQVNDDKPYARATRTWPISSRSRSRWLTAYRSW